RLAAEDGVLDVLLAFDPADEPHEVLGVVLLHHSAAGREVAPGDGVVNVAERDRVGPQRLGPDVDLVFERGPSDGRYFGDTAGGIELRDDLVAVDRPESGRVDRVRRAGLDGVPEDLTEGRRARREPG